VRKLLKKDLVWLGENMCRHKHTYLEHYSCFLTEKPDTSPLVEKIGIFDIETTGLKANYSHMLAWCMKEQGTDVIHEDLITSREARDKNDKRIVKSAVEEIKKYDRIVGYYSTRFDIPYVRTRALRHKMAFPMYRDLYHTDLYYICRQKFALHSNRLASVCEFFGIEAKNHPMTPDLWERAGAGQPEALKTVLTHCQEDVCSTDEVFVLLLDHMMQNKRSV
jgi:uncharacterized protein YprB with RNaseH-like and TPR domain